MHKNKVRLMDTNRCVICKELTHGEGVKAPNGVSICFYCAEAVYYTWGACHKACLDHCPHYQIPSHPILGAIKYREG